MAGHKQILPILDLFRLFAALLVVLVHYEIIFGQFVVYGSLGTTALSWFFILSGFIITYSYPDFDSFSDLKRFYVHRFIRIYPVYFLAVLVSAIFVSGGVTALGDQFFEQVRRPFEISYDLPQMKDAEFLAISALRHLTFTQSLSSVETLKLVFNGPLWSLVLEVYFYLAFPLLLILLKPMKSLSRIAIALIFGYVLQFLLIQYFLPDVESFNVMNLNVPIYTNPAIRGLEFVFGMLLYKAFALLPSITREEKHTSTPLLMAIFGYLVINAVGENFIPYQYSMFFSAVPVVALLVFILARTHWYPVGIGNKLCLWAGGISYVLYCFHWPLMEMVRFWNIVPQSVAFPYHLIILILFLLLVSHLIYRWIETPIRRLLYRKFKTNRNSVNH